jgi:hypothetical protein
MKPYQKLMAFYVEKHTGVDHIDTLYSQAEIDPIGTAYEISVENQSFNSASCTEVLEDV